MGGGEEEEGEAAAGGADEWHEGFRNDRGLLPSYVRDEAAAAALFVGKAVRVLRRPFRAGARGWEGRRPAGESAAMLPAGGGGDAGAWTPEDAAGVMRALEGLHCAEDFDRFSFERAVLNVQSVLAKRLWESLMERASLPRHLQALKDYYLLARGDFFHALLLETGELFATDPKPATAAVDLEAAVGRAALKSNADGDCFFPLVSPECGPLTPGRHLCGRIRATKSTSQRTTLGTASAWSTQLTGRSDSSSPPRSSASTTAFSSTSSGCGGCSTISMPPGLPSARRRNKEMARAQARAWPRRGASGMTCRTL